MLFFSYLLAYSPRKAHTLLLISVWLKNPLSVYNNNTDHFYLCSLPLQGAHLCSCLVLEAILCSGDDFLSCIYLGLQVCMCVYTLTQHRCVFTKLEKKCPWSALTAYQVSLGATLPSLHQSYNYPYFTYEEERFACPR